MTLSSLCAYTTIILRFVLKRNERSFVRPRVIKLKLKKRRGIYQFFFGLSVTIINLKETLRGKTRIKLEVKGRSAGPKGGLLGGKKTLFLASELDFNEA